MLPFLPPFLKKNQMNGGNDPSPNQFPNSSNAVPNQTGFNNPQILTAAVGGFNNQNAILSNYLVQQHLMQGLQNNIMSALFQQGIMPHLHGQQLNLLGALQNPNLMSLQQGALLGGALLGQNFNQMMGFRPNGLGCSQMPIFPPNSLQPVRSSGNSNHGLLGNGSPQIAQSFGNSTCHETQIATHKLKESMLSSPAAQNSQFNGQQWPQINRSQAGGKNLLINSPKNVTSNNFNPKLNEQGKRESPHVRFQKNQSGNVRNSWQRERVFSRNDQKDAGHRRKEMNPNFTRKNFDTSNQHKRPLAVLYSESEIQQWREARKKNFPSRGNLEKKLSSSTSKKEDRDSDAQLRRQQLKEVLAKQAELGVEVAEIPSLYLQEEPASNILPTGEGSKTNFQPPNNRFSNKRGRFRHENKKAKKQKFRNQTDPPIQEPIVKKREPTLLRKLLNADIRRDKSQILQAFRFMVLNSFFKETPHNPLIFPLIRSKDTNAPGFVKKSPQNNRDFKAVVVETGAEKSDTDEEDDFNGVGNVCEPFRDSFVLSGEKSEEGEITD